MLHSCVRRWSRPSRTPISIWLADCSTLLTGTSRARTRGRLMASQIASASFLSFLRPGVTYGFTACGGISITRWPSRVSSRAQ